MSAQDKLW